MPWYIVDADDFSLDSDDMYATARVMYGPFDTKAAAQAFQDEPANRWFDEAHGPIVERAR